MSQQNSVCYYGTLLGELCFAVHTGILCGGPGGDMGAASNAAPHSFGLPLRHRNHRESFSSIESGALEDRRPTPGLSRHPRGRIPSSIRLPPTFSTALVASTGVSPLTVLAPHYPVGPSLKGFGPLGVDHPAVASVAGHLLPRGVQLIP